MTKTIVSFLCCLLPVAASSVHSAEAPSIEPSRLSEILKDADAWSFIPAKYTVKVDGSTAALIPATGSLTLESKATNTAPIEVVLVCRLRPINASPASVVLQAACATLTDQTKQSLGFTLSVDGVKEQVSHTTRGERGKPLQSLSGILEMQAVSERSLGWPEEIRRAIEAQITQSPKVNETVFTMRCTVEPNRFRSYLNGRFCNELTLPEGMDASGKVKIQIAKGAELLSVRVQPLPKLDELYETILLDSHLNADAIAGKKIARDSLPAAGQVAPVDGVPFVFSAPNASGEDHVDLGVSWTRFGALPGYFRAYRGSMGGRWMGADKLDPVRIAMGVPKGRYKALHLIAAADGLRDKTSVVTAQIFRPGSGHPFNFFASVPELSAKNAGKSKPVPVKTSNGKAVQLYHVVIPFDPDGLSWFQDLDRIGLELTKEVQFFRGYPDPLEYSWHAGGLPSGVHIYAATLERVGTDIDIRPEQFGHTWTAPNAPRYTFRLRNSTGSAVKAKMVIDTRSEDGKDVTHQEREVPLPASNEMMDAQITLKPTRYGLHEMTVTLSAGQETATYRRNFAYLHPDTRERGNWEQGRGMLFGFWPWAGAHTTAPVEQELPLMAAVGAETSTDNYSRAKPEIAALAEKLHFISEAAFQGHIISISAFNDPKFKYDPAKPEESAKALIEAAKKWKAEPSAISRPTYVPFFPEPQIGRVTSAIWPTHYGEGDHQFKPQDEETYQSMLAKFLPAARAFKKEWPNLKLLLPYGDPMVTVVFLKRSAEARELIDGVAIDLPAFERTPEMQMGQGAQHRMFCIMKDIHEYKKDPYLVMIEGTCISSKDIDTGTQGQAEINTRNLLVLMGYGITRFESTNPAFECANYYGENHYGGGNCTRMPVAMPQPAFVQYATLTRHLNRANFTRYVPTGSTSTYCQQFKHYKTGKLVHVLWTVRGKRPVSVKVPAGTSLELYDPNDNVTTLKEKDGVVTIVVDQSPRYLEGLQSDAEIALGESDHTDSQPAAESARLGNLGDGTWKLVAKEEPEYAKTQPLQIERFLGKMSSQVVEAPKEQGGKALAVHLEKQEKDRGVMPFYTTFETRRPIEIPGKASHLGLWVKAASDWGRVVYVVRDAKGEKWLSVGSKEQWNCDDIHTWSAFCFDGWRYLRFELPSNLPYDCYREYGSTWWGSYGGDGIVDLPLKLEKVIVERRPKTIYGNELIPAKTDDVLLGDLYAEYAKPFDRTPEVVRLSKLRMPTPKGTFALVNPIADFAKTGVGTPTKVLKVADPEHEYDGTRCHVHFEPVAGAKSYDVWVSPYADGRGAIRLGKSWKESGGLIQGLRPDVDFYLFVAYTDQDGKASKPSEPLRFTLKDRFGYK